MHTMLCYNGHLIYLVFYRASFLKIVLSSIRFQQHLYGVFHAHRGSGLHQRAPA